MLPHFFLLTPLPHPIPAPSFFLFYSTGTSLCALVHFISVFTPHSHLSPYSATVALCTLSPPPGPPFLHQNHSFPTRLLSFLFWFYLPNSTASFYFFLLFYSLLVPFYPFSFSPTVPPSPYICAQVGSCCLPGSEPG
jgi:hypothetical protein